MLRERANVSIDSRVRTRARILRTKLRLLCVDGVVSCVEWRSFSFCILQFLAPKRCSEERFSISNSPAYRFVLGPPGTMAWVYHFSLREACENKYDFVLRFFASHVHPSKKTLAQTSRLRNVLRYLAAWDNQNAKNDINVALLDLSVLDLNNSKPLNGCCFGRLWCKSRCVFWRWTMAISGVSRSNSIRIRSQVSGRSWHLSLITEKELHQVYNRYTRDRFPWPQQKSLLSPNQRLVYVVTPKFDKICIFPPEHATANNSEPSHKNKVQETWRELTRRRQ